MTQSLFLWVSLFVFIGAFVLLSTQKQTKRSLFIGALIIFVYLTLNAIYVVADYFTGEGINDAVIFHLRYGLDGSGFGDYYLVMLIGVGLFIVSLMSAIAYYRLLKNRQILHFSRWKQWASFGLLLISFLIHPSISWSYEGILKGLGYESPLARQYAFSDYYEVPEIHTQEEEHPNLVYIFAESFELTYFDEHIFPSLVKHLRTLQPQSINFTNIEQALGTSWTIAGMTSALCALPLVTPSTNEHSPQGNSMSKMSTFYSGATCMSDLLHKDGYKMVYRSGSELAFAGVDKLYKTHHFDDVKGIVELKSQLKNKAYQTPWGLYDDTLFDISFSDFTKLSKSKQKFALFISTMDTHHPYGHVSKSCKAQTYKDGSNSMLNAVACSDELIARFIKQIQDSPYGKNTIIVVGSDHLAMHNMAIDDLMKGKRRNQLMILDPRITEGKSVDKLGTTLDVSAILMPLLGYNTPMGLGRNLLLEQNNSLMQELPSFDKILSAWHKDIARFWEFPKIDTNVSIDTKKQTIILGKTRYNLPVLLRLNENLEVSPFFEVKLKFFETTKLFGYLNDFLYSDPFIWVDSCSRIGVMDDKINKKAKWCLAYGKLGSLDLNMTTINQNTTLSFADINATLSQEAFEENATKRREKLLQIKEK